MGWVIFDSTISGGGTRIVSTDGDHREINIRKFAQWQRTETNHAENHHTRLTTVAKTGLFTETSDNHIYPPERFWRQREVFCVPSITTSVPAVIPDPIPLTTYPGWLSFAQCHFHLFNSVVGIYHNRYYLLCSGTMAFSGTISTVAFARLTLTFSSMPGRSFRSLLSITPWALMERVQRIDPLVQRLNITAEHLFCHRPYW